MSAIASLSAGITSEDASDVLQSQVAGAFYPEAMQALAHQLRHCIVKSVPSSIRMPKVVVAPHAGYDFSGAVAASAFHGLANRAGQIKRVVLIGPAHRMAFRGVATHPARAWRTPLGEVPVDWQMLRRVAPIPEVIMDDRPFLREHSLETHLPFLQVMLKDFQICPILVGDVAPETVARVLERVWGGPETLISVSTDLSHFLDDTAARALDAETRCIVETLDDSRLNAGRACGHRVLSGVLQLARNNDLRVTCVDLKNSSDMTDERDRVVGYGAFMMEYASQAALTQAERSLLLTTAARSLVHACRHNGMAPELTINGTLPMSLSAMRATFVTLENNGRLRGCIGSLKPHRPLLLDVVANVVKAGFSDPRFPKLTVQELAGLSLSIAILSTPRPITASSEEQLVAELSPDRDGLIIADQGKSALFLPQVWSSIADPRVFLRALKQKAGLAADHWSPTFQARRFTAEKFGAPIIEILKPTG